MPIKSERYISVVCDGCGDGYDDIGGTVKQEIETLLKHGWTGTYRKCFCPSCGAKMNGGEENAAG